MAEGGLNRTPRRTPEAKRAQNVPEVVREAARDPEKQKDLTPAEWRAKLKAMVATVVNVDELAEHAARDKAERTLTASTESMTGVSGFFKKMWKHGLAREYYRQKEIALARKEIKESGNIYATEDPAVERSAHDAAMKAVMTRFSHEYDLTHKGEEKRKLSQTLGTQRTSSPELGAKQDVKILIEAYAAGKIDDANFIEQKKRVLDAINEIEGGKKETTYTDNFLEIARQAKLAVEHGVKLDELDLNTDVIVGKAKDSIRTEANYNAADRVIDKLNNSRIGRYVNGSTIASAVAITFAVSSLATRRILSSKLATYVTFGASAVVGGGMMGLSENKRVKEERAQHARERAQGRTYEEKDSPRREEMEKYTHDMRDAHALASKLTEALYGKGGKEGRRPMTEQDVQNALDQLAQIEARITVMDAHMRGSEIDLLSYSNPAKAEEERLALDIARAEAKLELKKLPPDKARAAEKVLEAAITAEIDQITGGIETKDRLFQKMKAKRVGAAVVKGFAFGTLAGVGMQEIGSFMDSDQTGMIEHFTTGRAGGHTTTLESGRQFIANFFSKDGMAHSHDIGMVGEARMAVPDGTTFTPDGHGGYALMQGKEVLADHLRFDSHGQFTPDSLKALGAHGIHAAHTVDVFNTHAEGQVTPQQYLANHHELNAHHVSRELWYDNDTPKPVFDKNELKLWWGGAHNTGIDAAGKYTFSVEHMLKGGSYHNGLSAHAKELYEGHHLKMLLSVSHDSQATPIEVPIDADGNVHIDPTTEPGKHLFSTVNGKAHFLGRFAEVAQMTGADTHGTEHVKILATYEGKGLEHLKDTITTHHAVPHNILTGPAPHKVPFVWDPPLPIPLFYRTPLEPLTPRTLLSPGKLKEFTELTREPELLSYGYGASGDFGLLDRSKYKERISPKFAQNKELDVSREDLPLIREYLAKQSKEYREELQAMIADVKPMNEKIDLVITVPAYQEGKNLEKTLRNYAKLKNKERFEIVIFENHPAAVARDNTTEVIERMKSEFPDLNIVHLYKTYKEKPPIGEVRKNMVDAVMLMKERANIEKSVVIASNDADLEDISPNYADTLINAFQADEKLDAVGAKWDFPSATFKQFPLLHASQRLWQYMDIALRNTYLKAPDLIGRNSAFRSGAYAAIGGYNERAKLAEDLEIGWLLKDARGYDASRVQYLNKAWLTSNPRRAVVQLLSDGRLTGQYGDFHTNEEVRKAPLDELLKDKKDFDDGTFLKEVQSIHDFYSPWKKSKGGWADDAFVTRSFDRAMHLLGISYRMDGDTVVITDASRLKAGLDNYANAGGRNTQPRSTAQERGEQPASETPPDVPKRQPAPRRSAPQAQAPIAQRLAAQRKRPNRPIRRNT